MSTKPHKWKIRAGFVVLAAGVYKLQQAIRLVIDSCQDQTTQACHTAQGSLKTAIYVVVTGVVVFAYGYIKRFKKLKEQATRSL